MSISKHVEVVFPADEKWKKMKRVWDSCMEAEIEVPREIMEFFNYETPDDKGIVIDLEREDCYKPYKGEMVDGFVIDLSKVPARAKYLRFYNSY